MTMPRPNGSAVFFNNKFLIFADNKTITSKYLNDCRLFVTLEPCVMCAGASYWVRVGEIIFGASDKKKGFLTLNPHILHPSTKVKKGIYENECSQMLKDFFKTKR